MNKRIAGRAAAVGPGIALMLAAALLVLVPGRATADPNNASGTWELHLEVPNVAMAPNGDRWLCSAVGSAGMSSRVRSRATPMPAFTPI